MLTASVLGQHLSGLLLPIWELFRNMNVVIHNTDFLESKKLTEGGHGTHSVGT